MTKYKNAYTEVYEIIEQLNEEEYNKIPSEVIKAMKLWIVIPIMFIVVGIF